MNVLFDISYYAIYCLREDGGRPAGMSRYVEELSREMVSRADVTALFTTLHSATGEVQSLPHARSRGSFLRGRLASAWITSPPGRAPEDMPPRPRIAGAFDVFHSLTHMYGFPPAGRVHARARFLTVHDLIPVLFPEFLSRSTVLSNFERLLSSIDIEKDWIIAVSEATKRDFCKHTSMSPDRVFVIPEAASRRIFHPVREAREVSATLGRLGVPDASYILSVCLQEPKKNLPRLIRCFYRLLRDGSLADVNLVLVGAKGWRYEEIEAAVDSAPDLRKRIVFTGPLPDEDLPAVYSGAMFFAFPSLYEGFGLPVLEAMQCGAPVITSNLGSLPEIVGSAGILVDPRSEQELCEAMDRLARSPSERADLRQRGLSRASAFSWEHTVTKTLEAYRAALDHPA